MEDKRAQVLARDGNAAVVQLEGRAFPGIHLQGDTFAELRRQLADVAGRLRHGHDEREALDDLDYAIEEMTQILGFYETVLAEHRIRPPYRQQQRG